MKLIFIHGPAAAGKHTIGTLLGDKIDIPLFHNHLVVDLAKSLFDFGEPGFVRIREATWRVCFQEIARAKKSIIFTFNPERTVSPELIKELIEIYKNEGGSVYFIQLICSDQEILQRIGNESRKKFGKLTDGSIYTEFKRDGGFDFPKLPEPLLTIDTERSAPKESAELIVKALKSEPDASG